MKTMETMNKIISTMEKDIEEYLKNELERYKALGYTEDDLVLGYVPSRCFSTSIFDDNTIYSTQVEVCLRPKTKMELEKERERNE